MSSNERLQAYALVGVRAEIEQLLERTVQIKQDFPRLSSLSTVQAALSSTIDELDEISGGKLRTKRTRDDDDDEPAAKPKPKMRSKSARTLNGRPESAPKERRKGASGGLQNTVRLVAWLKGRDVLNLLAAAPNGLPPEEIGKALKLSRATAMWRLKVRARKGHVRVSDEATTTFVITAKGLAALKEDRDDTAVSSR